MTAIPYLTFPPIIAMPDLTLAQALRSPLFHPATIKRPTFPNVEPGFAQFNSFRNAIPRTPPVSLANLTHPFVDRYHSVTVPFIPAPSRIFVSSYREVRLVLNEQLVEWLEAVFAYASVRRRVRVLRLPRPEHEAFKGPPTRVNPGFVVDFAFTWGETLDDGVPMVMQTKNVGTLAHVTFKENENRVLHQEDDKIAREARAYAVLYRTRTVILFDFIKLIRFRWPLHLDVRTGTPEVDILDVGECNANILAFALISLCQGLDMLAPTDDWI